MYMTTEVGLYTVLLQNGSHHRHGDCGLGLVQCGAGVRHCREERRKQRAHASTHTRAHTHTHTCTHTHTHTHTHTQAHTHTRTRTHTRVHTHKHTHTHTHTHVSTHKHIQVAHKGADSVMLYSSRCLPKMLVTNQAGKQSHMRGQSEHNAYQTKCK